MSSVPLVQTSKPCNDQFSSLQHHACFYSFYFLPFINLNVYMLVCCFIYTCLLMKCKVTLRFNSVQFIFIYIVSATTFLLIVGWIKRKKKEGRTDRGENRHTSCMQTHEIHWASKLELSESLILADQTMGVPVDQGCLRFFSFWPTYKIPNSKWSTYAKNAKHIFIYDIIIFIITIIAFSLF